MEKNEPARNGPIFPENMWYDFRTGHCDRVKYAPMRRWSNVVVVLGHRLRHWPSTTATMYKLVYVYTRIRENSKLPNKHETLNQCWVDVGTLPTTLAQHQPRIDSTYRVCWESWVPRLFSRAEIPSSDNTSRQTVSHQGGGEIKSVYQKKEIVRVGTVCSQRY